MRLPWQLGKVHARVRASFPYPWYRGPAGPQEAGGAIQYHMCHFAVGHVRRSGGIGALHPVTKRCKSQADGRTAAQAEPPARAPTCQASTNRRGVSDGESGRNRPSPWSFGLISSHPAVFFSHNESANSAFSTINQRNEQGAYSTRRRRVRSRNRPYSTRRLFGELRPIPAAVWP
jgi:hypothetical protein